MGVRLLRALASAGLVAILAVTVPMASPAAGATPPVFVTTWGTTGTGHGQFKGPTGVATDGTSVYVADMNNHRIQKFTASGAYVASWGKYGTAKGEFRGPWGVAVDGHGNVYVADTGNDRIQKFTSTGQLLAVIGSSGSGDGQLSQPKYLAIDPGGNVYVTDSANCRVQVFGSNGAFVRGWGTCGQANGQVGYVDGIDLDADGNVYVADSSFNRVHKFSSKGQFLTRWGSLGSGDGQFNMPRGLAVLGTAVLVIEVHGNRVQEFTRTGEFLTKWGSSGGGDGRFNTPHGIAADAAGNIYVADTGWDRIQKFRVQAGATRRPDGRIRVGSRAFVGDNVYNATGSGQSVKGSAKPGRVVTFGISIQNDGTTADGFKVRAGGSTSAYTIKYLKGTTDITAQVVAGKYRTANLAKGASTLITARVTVKPSAATGSSLTRPVTIVSLHDATKKDVVKLTARRS